GDISKIHSITSSARAGGYPRREPQKYSWGSWRDPCRRGSWDCDCARPLAGVPAKIRSRTVKYLEATDRIIAENRPSHFRCDRNGLDGPQRLAGKILAVRDVQRRIGPEEDVLRTKELKC